MNRPPALSPEMVQEFVAKAHSDLERVQALLQQEPALLHASWDWGGGDWETGLGAAAHVGHRGIARYLLEQGARLDLFAAAMLGYLEVVKAILAIYPEMRHAHGPHKIPLMAHAQAGGRQAEAVVKYLRTFSESS